MNDKRPRVCSECRYFAAVPITRKQMGDTFTCRAFEIAREPSQAACMTPRAVASKPPPASLF